MVVVKKKTSEALYFIINHHPVIQDPVFAASEISHSLMVLLGRKIHTWAEEARPTHCWAYVSLISFVGNFLFLHFSFFFLQKYMVSKKFAKLYI
jgi:hypothetical protein